MNHLSQYRNSAIAAPHSHQSSSSSSHFSSANCLQSFPSSSRFSPHNFMERVMQIPNDLSRYQVSNFEQTRLETLSELDKIQTMNSGNCYGKSPSSSVATSVAGSSCSNGVLSSESRNYLSASNLVNTPMVDTKVDTNLLPASNNTTSSSSKNCNDCFKIPTASASTSTSPLVIAKCMIDVSTMTDPLTVEEQERLGQWEGFAAVQSGNKVAEYLTSLRQFLKLTPPGESKKRGGLGDVRIVTSPDGSRLYCCSECQMAYPDKTLLEQHLAQHKVERRFICNICGAGLKRKEHLDRHQLSHSTDRPFTCGACPKTFKRNEHLARHYVTHSGEKHQIRPYACPACPKSFKRNEHLARHFEARHYEGEKNQVCTECGKGFYRRDHLQKHFQGHLTKRLRMAAMQTT
uniref:Zinc finger protein 534 n=1 Tax=Cacopsylla melanoneura TaxID=428564 RepID=A0A8D9EMM9_9HEMI